jgi:hypothetical protein
VRSREPVFGENPVDVRLDGGVADEQRPRDLLARTGVLAVRARAAGSWAQLRVT